MGALIVNWVLGWFALALLANIFPGFRVTEFESALLATSIVALISGATSALLKRMNSQAGLVIASILLVLADAFLFRLTALVIPGFAMRAFYPALAGALLLLGLHLAVLRFTRVRASVQTGPLMHS
ncbi:MAG: phage holin family protein [Acidobacteriota bacterium]